MQSERDPRLNAIPDIHGHAKGEHKPYTEERPLPLTARMLFLWFYHACRRGYPRFMMVSDHMNYLTFEDPAAVNLVRRALKLAAAGDLYGAAETANVDVGHAQVVCEGLRRGMRYSIGAEVDNDPRARPDAQNIVDAMRPDGMIRSVHFIPIEHPVHGPNWNWPFDNPEFVSLFDHVGTDRTWELYVQVLLDAAERLPGQIVGHFYVPAIFGHWPSDEQLESYENRLLDVLAARGNMAVEFNTRFLYRDHTEEERARYLAANKRLLRKAKERGVGIAIGSDAHSPKDQGEGFETVLAILDELEINELVFPIEGRLARVALRVIKPPEPEPAPAPEPVAGPAAPAADGAAARPRKARPQAAPTRVKSTSPAREETEHSGASERGSSERGSSERSSTTGERSRTNRPPKAPAKAPAPKPRSAAKMPATSKAAAAKKAAPAKKAAAKAPAKKSAAAAKKPLAKKTAPPKASAARKTTARKTAAKKGPARKAVVKKAVRTRPKRAGTKKAAARKPAGKKASVKRGTPKRR